MTRCWMRMSWLALAMAACGPTVEQPAAVLEVDLGELLLSGQAERMAARQDLGAASARGDLLEGWSTDETARGFDFVWGVGARSSLTAHLPFARGVTLSFRCSAWPDPQELPQSVQVSINGTSLPAVVVGPDWQTFEISVPDGVLLPEGNVVELAYGSHREPGDLRPIAVAWDWIEWSARTPAALAEVDIGEPSGRAQLRSGWALDERGAGRSFAWSVEPVASIEVDIPAGQRAEVVAFGRSLGAGSASGQTVELVVNGHSIGAQYIGTEWSDLSWFVDADVWREGPDAVELRSEWVRQPGGEDARTLGVAWSGLRVEGRTPSSSGSLVLRAGHILSTAVELGPKASVELEGWKGPEGARLELVVRDPLDGVVARRVLPQQGGAFALDLDRETWRTHRVALSLELPHGELGSEALVAGLRMVDAKEVRAKRPNVVVILLDTVRADHLSVYGYSKPTTPRLSEFAERAVVYDRAWANSSWTRASVASLWTGLLPRVHGAVGRADALPDSVSTLPEVLQSVGYDTAAFVTNGNVGEPFGFARGVSSFHMYGEQRESPTFHRPAEVVVVDAMKWARERQNTEDPFFLYVHLTDPHAPYQPPEPYRSLFAADVPSGEVGTNAWVQARARGSVPSDVRDAEMAKAMYDAEIAYTDAQVGVLLDALEHLGQLDDALVIVTSDHGEEFLEHGGWEHGQTLHSEVLDVPLIIRFPDGRTGREHSRAQLIDVFPTVLGAAGLSVTDRDGMDLASLAGSPLRDAHASVVLDARDGDAFVSGDLKAIDMLMTRRGEPQQLLFNTDSDRRELMDLKGSSERAFVERFEQIEAKRARSAHETEAVEMSEDLEATLRALGYLE